MKRNAFIAGALALAVASVGAPRTARSDLSDKGRPPRAEVDWNEFNATAIVEKRERDLDCEREAKKKPAKDQRTDEEIRNACIKTFTCSGVALNRWLVITAAHCTDQALSMRVTFDFLYDPAQPTFIEIEPTPQVNSGYHPTLSNFHNDIAILKLAQAAPAKLNYPRFLPEDFEIPVGTPLERIGTGGRYNPDGKLENRKTWVNAALIRHSNGDLWLLDALSVVGDSGGPIFYRDTQEAGWPLYLVGIHSTRVKQPDGRTFAVGVLLRPLSSWLENWPFYVQMR